MKYPFILILTLISYAVTAQQSYVISTPKMNVLYAGLETPLDIAASSIPEKDLRVDANYGMVIKKEGRYYIKARVEGNRICTIRIGRAGKGKTKWLYEQEFRVRTIPKPEAKWGVFSSGTFHVQMLLAMPGLYAVIDNFVYEGVRYNIKSYRIKLKGKYNTQIVSVYSDRADKAKALISQAQPGDSVVIDSIIVLTPDSTNIKLNDLGFAIAIYKPSKLRCTGRLLVNGVLMFVKQTDVVPEGEKYGKWDYEQYIEGDYYKTREEDYDSFGRLVYRKEFYLDGRIKYSRTRNSDTSFYLMHYFHEGGLKYEGSVYENNKSYIIYTTMMDGEYWPFDTAFRLSVDEYPLGKWNMYYNSSELCMSMSFAFRHYSLLEAYKGTCCIGCDWERIEKEAEMTDHLRFICELDGIVIHYDRQGKEIKRHEFKTP